MFQGSFGFQKYLQEVQREYQGSFKGVSGVFQDSFLDALRKFQGCFKKVSRFCQGRLKGVSMEF